MWFKFINANRFFEVKYRINGAEVRSYYKNNFSKKQKLRYDYEKEINSQD